MVNVGWVPTVLPSYPSELAVVDPSLLAEEVHLVGVRLLVGFSVGNRE